MTVASPVWVRPAALCVLAVVETGVFGIVWEFAGLGLHGFARFAAVVVFFAAVRFLLSKDPK